MTVSCTVLWKRSPREVFGTGVSSVDFVTVLILSFGSFCPGKERQGHLARPLVIILAQTLPQNFQVLGVFSAARHMDRVRR